MDEFCHFVMLKGMEGERRGVHLIERHIYYTVESSNIAQSLTLCIKNMNWISKSTVKILNIGTCMSEQIV